jgi:Neutral/alkaline non-lysosomal ceramidase, N-terminal
VLLLSAPDLVSAQNAAGRLRAGAAKVEITQKESELQLPTDSIRDHLFVRAIIVDNGSTCAVLVGIDTGGIRDNVANEAITKASASTKCPAENFIISATHTHSGGVSGPDAGTSVGDAIVSAVGQAKANLAPARIGYGTAKVDLNVNRDLYNSQQEWRQQPNPDGPSDKTLAIVEFVGADDIPIAVYMNYAMHPVNFYMTGVVSADFPGEATRYVEEMFDNKTVAVFSQGAEGDQNPRLAYSAPFRYRQPQTATQPRPAAQTQPAGQAQPAATANSQGFNPRIAAATRQAIAPENLAAYKKAIARTGDYVVMLGTMIGTTATRVMREDIKPVDTAIIWGAQQGITCPGRERLDAANPARENVFPGYKDGPDVNLKVGLLRLGDINFATVNGEAYSEIAMKLKAAAPASKTIFVGLANGMGNSGYIYSDAAYSHLTFQVIGSRLKPGCTEGKIISTAIDLMHKSGE